jgi:hypothetical protein
MSALSPTSSTLPYTATEPRRRPPPPVPRGSPP